MSSGEFDLAKDVSITFDGCFRTGNDSEGDFFRYEAAGIKFWFGCERSFLSDDRTDFVIKVLSIGQKEKGRASFFTFSHEQRQTIRDQIIHYFRKNTFANVMSSHARLVEVRIWFPGDYGSTAIKISPT